MISQEEELQHRGRPLSSLPDAELRSSAVGDGSDDFADDARATVEDLIQQGRQRKEDAAREREELEQQRGELEPWKILEALDVEKFIEVREFCC